MDQGSRLEMAIRQIEFARQYTERLLVDLTDEEWLRQPAGAATHIAWQVGHLAMAQYGLCLFRIRGRREIDLSLSSKRDAITKTPCTKQSKQGAKTHLQVHEE